MSPPPIGVAVVGAGYWGPTLARVVAESTGTVLRWNCDLDPTRADRVAAQHGARASTTLDEVLADPGVDAVLVATPPITHAALARQCLDADRHVLVEKPMALSSSEAADLGIRAERRGLILMCDHTYCYAPEASSSGG